MVGLLCTNSELNKLFEINLDIFRLQSGVQRCPMAVTSIFSYLEWDWFNTVCCFLARVGCSLLTTNPYYFSPKCAGDRNLMDAFIHARWTKRWLEAYNRCRIFPRVITLSDLADVLGKNSQKES